jgi:hypothetical protein
MSLSDVSQEQILRVAQVARTIGDAGAWRSNGPAHYDLWEGEESNQGGWQ